MSEFSSAVRGTWSAAPESVRRALRRIFLDELHIDVPSDDTDLLQQGLLDSLGLVELLLAIEETFHVTITLEELEIDNVRSVQAITDYLISHDGLNQ